MSWLSRVANVFRRRRLDRDIAQELSFHRERRTQDLIAGGLSPAAARRQAALRFGNATAVQEQSAEAKLAVWLESLVQDIRFGLRLMRKHPAFTAVAVLSLALAIGLATSVYSLADALLWRPLPVADPDRLFQIAFHDNRGPVEPELVSFQMFEQMRDAAAEAIELFAIGAEDRQHVVTGPAGEEEEWISEGVTPGMFSALGLRPLLGRVFTGEDRGGNAPVVLSFSFWQSRFGGDPAVIGRTFRPPATLPGRRDLTLDIVGVLEPGFTGADAGTVTDLWMPLAAANPFLSFSSQIGSRVWGRLKRGVSPERARGMLQAAVTNLRRALPDSARGPGQAYLDTPLVLHPAAAGSAVRRLPLQRPLTAMMGVVALVFVVACVNLANLYLARAGSREREIAMRASLGADRFRLIRQMLIECGLLTGTASILALAIAYWSRAPLARLLNANLQVPASLDVRLLVILLALGGAATLLFGTVPALRLSKLAASAAGNRATVRYRPAAWLIAVQVACCFAVLFLGGLLLTTYWKRDHQDAGFRTAGVYQFTLSAPDLVPQMGRGDPAQVASVWRRLREHMAALPGVAGASGNSGQLPPGLVTAPLPGGSPAMLAAMSVFPGLFDMLRIPILEGRDFTEAEAALVPPGSVGSQTVLINQKLKLLLFGQAGAVGRSIQVETFGRPATHQIVGVVADSRLGEFRETPPPTVYFATSGNFNGGLWVACDIDPSTLLPLLRREITRTYPFRVMRIISVEEMARAAIAQERALAVLSLLLSGIALLLATVGFYGILSYSVLERTRELGIRLALGLSRHGVARMLLRDLAPGTLSGVAAGAALGFASTRLIESLLFETQPSDPASLLAPALVLAAALACAAVPPVWRAMRINAAAALRHE